MSYFYGTIPVSARKTVPTARGHKKTGLATIAASWAGAIRVNLWHDPNHDVDRYEVQMIPWESRGDSHTIAAGEIGNANKSEVFIKKPLKHGSTSSYAQTTVRLVQ